MKPTSTTLNLHGKVFITKLAKKSGKFEKGCKDVIYYIGKEKDMRVKAEALTLFETLLYTEGKKTFRLNLDLPSKEGRGGKGNTICKCGSGGSRN